MSIDYSIIIPAYNEAELLPGTLDSVHRAMSATGMTGQVIVVDNNSADETASIAGSYGALVVTEPINQISRARNAGARFASGRYLIFLDADTWITPELLQKSLALLDSGRCCGGGVRVQGEGEVSGMTQMFMTLWNSISVKFNLAAGCFLFCLREGFEAVDGFSDKVYASEEIWLSRKLKIWGRDKNLQFDIITDPAIVTSMRKLEWFTSLYLMSYFFILLIFPPAVFSRRLCRPWYDRPGNSEE